MVNYSNSVLVVGFNTRPLAYSLKKAGYDVYAVDFFGDLDLYPCVEDYIIVLKELSVKYGSLKEKYSKFLVDFALRLHRKHRDTKFLLVASGLDDAYEGRKLILDELKNFETISVNNSLRTIMKSRDIESIFEFLTSQGYKVPLYCSFEKFQLFKNSLRYPFILKKKRSAGGINVFKIEDKKNLISKIRILEKLTFIPSEWLIQEYIEGIPVSCTVISDGKECEIISINRQIIGEKFLNSPTEFMYCGNIVPAGLLSEEEKIISEISTILTKQLGLKGINGFDFVLRGHHPYFMECNPRIPGSIRASEIVLNLNLLDLHIKSFIPNEWKNIKKLILSAKPRTFATKFILFAPNEIDKSLLTEINNLEFVHDKTEPIKNVLKGEPLCTILYEAKDFLKSFNGAKQIVDRISRIIG
ncbi:MAG: ATP-grasp domain-containing protein [Promethearchaeota archaeon]|nr:MAG: ATP-grasp domain-containing protein [Candidatus Lokiarchaeota archaeon]